MIRNTTIGFEYQTNQLSLSEIRQYGVSTVDKPYLNYYKSKVLFDLRERIRVYGDVTNPAFEKHVSTLEKYLKENKIEVLWIEDSKKKIWDLPVDHEFTDFFNEAEFLVTYADPDPTRIPLTYAGIMNWITGKTQESSLELQEYFQSLKKREIVSVKGLVPNSGKRKKEVKSMFSYTSLLEDPENEHVIFSARTNIPIKDYPFRVQTTIGLELRDVLPVLRILQRAYEELPQKSFQYDQRALRVFPNTEKEVSQWFKGSTFSKNSPFYVVAVMILYMEKNRRYRKHSLFLFRHLQRDLISLLSNEELTWLYTFYPKVSDLRVHRNIIQNITKRRQHEPMNQTVKRQISLVENIHRDYQGMGQVGYFPVSLKNPRILIEIRMIDVLLTSHLPRKSRKRNVEQLEKDLDPYSLSLSQLLSKKLRHAAV